MNIYKPQNNILLFSPNFTCYDSWLMNTNKMIWHVYGIVGELYNKSNARCPSLPWGGEGEGREQTFED